MVHEHPETRLDGFDVRNNILLRGGAEIARFPTPICELARLNDRLFVILHPYPIRENMEYGGTNLWSVDLRGNVLWKAENVNQHLKYPNAFNNYRGIHLLDRKSPKIYVETMDDYYNPIVDVATGKHISRAEAQTNDEKILTEIFSEGRLYLYALPCDPPSASKLRDFSLR